MFDKRLLALISGARKYVVLDVVLQWFALLATISFVGCAGHTLQALVDSTQNAQHQLGVLALIAVICAVLRWLCSAAAQRYGSKASSLAKKTVRSQAFTKLLELGPSYREQVSDSEASQLLGEGAERLELYVGRYLPQLFFAVLAPLTLFIALAPLCLPAALAMLVCVPLIPISIAFTMKRAKKAMGAYWDSYVDLGGEFLEALRGLVTLKVYRADGARHERLNRVAEEFRVTTMSLLTHQLRAVTIMDFFTYGGAAVGTIVALVCYARGSLDLGGAFVVTALALQFFAPMRKLGTLFHTAMNAQSAIDGLFSLLNAPVPQRQVTVERESAVEEGSGACKSGPGLICHAMGYTYPDGREALAGIDFEARAGSYVGITGVSGSGKSTLAHIVCGRLTGYEGSVQIAGVEARELAPASLHELVTYVGQDAHVFKGTLRSNLQMAREDASDANMWEALRRCSLDQFALSQGGLDAAVDEGGANLSAGQRQRLCFARALLHDTPIYVFDEATSSVDAEAEEDLLECVASLSVERTVVLITHRLSSLAFCDRIYVLDKGSIAEEGTHDELIARSGCYAQLWAQQVQLERLAAQGEREAGRIELTRASAKPQLITERMYDVAERMPRGVAALMLNEVEVAPIIGKIRGAESTAPLGHPSWIPIGDANARPQDVTSKTDANAAEDTNKGKAAKGEGAANNERSKRAGTLDVLWRLTKLTRDQWPQLAQATVYGLFSSLAALGILVVAGLVLAGKFEGLLVVACLLIAICGLVRGPLRYRERLSTHDQTFRTLAILRDKTFGAMRRLAPAKLEGRGVGDLLSLLTTDIELLERFYSQAIGPVVVAAVVSVISFIAMLFVSPAQAILFALGFVLVGVVVPLVSARMLNERGEQVRQRAVDMNGFVLECLQGLPEIVQFGWGERVASDMDLRADRLSKDERGMVLRSALMGALPDGLVVLFGGAVVCLGGLLASEAGSFTAGTVAACALAFLGCIEPVRTVSGLSTSLHQTVAAARRVLDILDEKPAVEERQTGRPAPDEFTGAVLNSVTFAYPGSAEPVLEDVTVKVEPGSLTRIIGASGTGKSTAVKLLMRFWDPQTGSVTLSGVDARELSTSDLRGMEGYLSQRTFLFSGTLRENLLFVKPDATETQLNEAIRRASLADLVDRLPQGLDTQVGGEAGGLSDGELQRLGLARIFLHDAPLMLLDEPTSNLDVLNEALIMQSLAVECDGKTIVLVSHRPSAAAIADVTYVMNANVWES